MVITKKDNFNNAVTIFLCALTAFLFGIELHLLFGSSSQLQVSNYILDEAGFYFTASNYKVTDSLISCYGFLFWEASHLFLKYSPFDFSINLITLRGIFLSLKYLAFFFAYLTIKKLRGSTTAAVFYLVLLLTPGYYFYGKVFSPEYLTLSLLAVSVWALGKDEGKISSYFYFSIATTLTAIFVKMVAAPFLLLPSLYLLSNFDNLNVKKFFISSVIVLLTGAINLLPLFTALGRHNLLYWLHVCGGHFELNAANFNVWFHMDGRTWDQIPTGGIFVDFTPIVFCLLYITSFRLSSFIINKLTFGIEFLDQPKNKLFGASVFLTGIAMLFLTTCSTTTTYWYLFPAYLVFLIGIFSYLPLPKEKFPLIAMVVIVLIFNIGRIHWRIHDREWHNKLLERNEKTGLIINQYLIKNYPQGGTVLTDILVPLNVEPPFKLLPIATAPLCSFIPYKVVKFIIVNTQISNSPLSPCITQNYKLKEDFKGLQLYVK